MDKFPLPQHNKPRLHDEKLDIVAHDALSQEEILQALEGSEQKIGLPDDDEPGLGKHLGNQKHPDNWN